jgi:hypothetical protein
LNSSKTREDHEDDAFGGVEPGICPTGIALNANSDEREPATAAAKEK